ncbi:hypothetical protein [Wolbachia endosymbiont (group A) of Sicus ferrugineus]|nr:hypothetical protein [Wolbachia endosymbiont (group A) of Sicus ferrugineus]
MPWENESVFIAEGQSLDVDEQKKNDILIPILIVGQSNRRNCRVV